MVKESSGTSLVNYTAGHMAVFTTEFPTDKPKARKLKDEESDITDKKWASYFETDDFPRDLMAKAAKISIANTAISTNVDCHFGSGIEWFKKTYEGPLPVKKCVEIPDWTKFVQETNYNIEHSNIIDCLETYGWIPVRFLTNEAKTKIMVVEALDPTFSRIEKRNPATGKSENLYFSYKFPNPDPKNPEELVVYPIFDPQNPREHSEFVVLMSYKCWGNNYYPFPHYYSVYQNGWVDVATQVPDIIKSLYESFNVIKYHVHIPTSYFIIKYKGFDEMEKDERIKIMKDEQEAMNRYLTDKKYPLKTFMSVFGVDDSGKELGDWKIEPIQNYIKTDAELPNSAAAMAEISAAYNFDPTFVGFGIPGGKNLSGSGSDKREALKIKQALMFRDRQYSLYFPRFIAWFNDMKLDGAEPQYIDIDMSATLDESKKKGEAVVNG